MLRHNLKLNILFDASLNDNFKGETTRVFLKELGDHLKKNIKIEEVIAALNFCDDSERIKRLWNQKING